MRRRIWIAASLGGALLLLVLGCAYTGSSKPTSTPENEFESARREYEERHYFDAVLKLTEFIDRNPGSILVDQAIFYLGKSYQAQKDWVLAAAEFERLVRDFPESRSACDAEYSLSQCYWEQSRKPQYDQRETGHAIIQLDRFISRCPDHPGVEEAEALIELARDRLAEKRYRTARLYVKMKEFESALIYCDLLLDDYADTRWACDARRLKAEVLVSLERAEEARVEVDWLRQNCTDAEGLIERIEELELEMTGSGES